MAADDRPVNFTTRDARRISNVVRSFERDRGAPPPPPRRYLYEPPPQRFLGKLTSQLNWGSSATVAIWEGDPGDEIDSGRELTAWDWLLDGSGDYIASGTKVVVEWINQAYYVVSAACP